MPWWVWLLLAWGAGSVAAGLLIGRLIALQYRPGDEPPR